MKKTLKNNLITKNQATRLYNLNNPIVGLTGGIATGKSTVSKILKNQGFFIIDADQLVKDIYLQDKTINFIEATFPVAISNRIIDFKKLRELAFSNADSKKSLEDFIYKYLPDAFKEKAALAQADELIIYDVPLLFEKGLNNLVDQSICVYCPQEIQIERIIQRDQSSRELAIKILSNQMDIEDKKIKANFVINNLSNLEILEKNIHDIFVSLINN